jgi:hypothetical protein
MLLILWSPFTAYVEERERCYSFIFRFHFIDRTITFLLGMCIGNIRYYNVLMLPKQKFLFITFCAPNVKEFKKTLVPIPPARRNRSIVCQQT